MGGKAYVRIRRGSKSFNLKSYLNVDRRIILKLILKKWDGGKWSGLIWLRLGTGGWALVNEVMNLWVS